MNVLLAAVAALASCVLLLLAAGVALWRGRRDSTRAAGWLRARRAVVAACVVLALGLGAALVACVVTDRPPRQAEVAAWLSANRTDLEKLRGMLEADRLRGVLDYGREYSRDSLRFEPPDCAGLSSARGAEYQRLMRATGCRRVDVWSDGRIGFAFRAWGTAGRGWRVSVVWSRDAPSPLWPTIDGSPATHPRGSDHGFSRLDGRWYALIVR